jgi:hypothetical protein
MEEEGVGVELAWLAGGCGGSGCGRGEGDEKSEALVDSVVAVEKLSCLEVGGWELLAGGGGRGSTLIGHLGQSIEI